MGTRYQKGDYVEVQKPKKLDRQFRNKVVGRIENVQKKGDCTMYKVVFYTYFHDRGETKLSAWFKASDLRYPEPRTISIRGKEIERGDTVKVQHGFGDNREVNSGEVTDFGMKDGKRTISYGNVKSSSGRWAKKGQILAVNGKKIRPMRKTDMKSRS